MKKLNILFTLILFISITACNDDNNADKLPSLSTSEIGEKIVNENNKFALDFFKTISESETKDNYMVSPVSLSLALGMAYNGSEGSTKDAFESLFNYTVAQKDVNEFNRQLINTLSSSVDGSTMDIANSIWVKNDFSVKDEFINLNIDYYNAEVQNLDFEDLASVDIINQWVSDNTNDKIPSIISEIPNSARLYLINAIYFNATWQHEFDTANTLEMDFYKSETDIVPVDMMMQKEEVGLYSNDLLSTVRLPYDQDKYSIILLMPNYQKTVNDILSELTAENWATWTGNYLVEERDVRIPKFKLDYKNELKDELSLMGLGIAFSDQADFSMINEDARLTITKVLQKTYIDVNEVGTEAAAVTSITVGTTSIGPQEPAAFTLNKPFIYAIIENSTGSICFMGKVGEPVYED